MGPLQLAQDIGSKWIYWPWVGDHLDEIRTRLAEHITLTFWAVLLGFLIAFPLALLAARYRRLYPPVTGNGRAVHDPIDRVVRVPDPVDGIMRTMRSCLVAYTLLILIRNIVAARQCSAGVAGAEMGYRRTRQLFVGSRRAAIVAGSASPRSTSA
jgi:osmoprotectant transport system permease protein